MSASTLSPTELLRAFIQDPHTHLRTIQMRSTEVLDALRDEQLAEELDNSGLPPRVVFEAFGASSLEQPIRPSGREESDQQIVEAVEDCLLHSASAIELELLEGTSPLLVYKAVESLSSIMRRLATEETPDRLRLRWTPRGVWRVKSSGEELSLGYDDLVLGVARSLELFTIGKERKPTRQAEALVSWAYRCIFRVGGLLRHFIAHSADEGGIYLTLREAGEWRMELSERWAPISETELNRYEQGRVQPRHEQTSDSFH